MSAVVDVVPERCGGCSKKLKGSDPEPRRSQVVEVPPIKPEGPRAM